MDVLFFYFLILTELYDTLDEVIGVIIKPGDWIAKTPKMSVKKGHKQWRIQEFPNGGGALKGFLHVRNCSSPVPHPNFLRPESYSSAATCICRDIMLYACSKSKSLNFLFLCFRNMFIPNSRHCMQYIMWHHNKLVIFALWK